MLKAVAVPIAFAILSAVPGVGNAQEPEKGATATKSVEKPEAEVYIPQDLNDAIATLKRDLDQASMTKIKACKTADEFMGLAHFSFGMGLRNSWGLWGGSRLAKWFNSNDIFHPDDMSGVILEALWSDLTGHEFSLEQKAAEYHAYWEGQKGPEPPNCPTCGAKVEFSEMMGRQFSPTNYISYQHGICTKSKQHNWLWDKKSKWRKFTPEEWSKLSKRKSPT